MRAASPPVLVSAVLAEPAPESKLPATEYKSQPTRLSVSCEISSQISGKLPFQLSLAPPFLNAEAKIKFPLFIPLAAAHDQGLWVDDKPRTSGASFGRPR